MTLAWWQREAVYQIYPRSFNDADGDGIGDLRGIEQRLDHIAELAGAIWLSPIYPSPMADFGYDVADYCDVDPVFGTLADLDRLVEAAHARGLRVILDWVVNHTSERHPWFEQSRASRENPKRDWYVWRDEPDDWPSAFPAVGSAWTHDERTGQWYMHTFMPQQPDLNWDNPEVEAAMHDVARFWLDRGVDGFRLDAVTGIAKDGRHQFDAPAIHRRLAAIRRVTDEYPERMLVGEVYLFDVGRIAAYVEPDQLHMAHNFIFAQLPWDAAAFREAIAAAPGAWPAWFVGNHDMPRPATRLGPRQARAALLLLYALRGTPFIHQGEELGLPDAAIPAERVVDVDGRDPERAPIPWCPGRGRGFTTGEPWLPFAKHADALTQAHDPGSALNLTRALARLRRETLDLQDGAQRPLDAPPGVLAFARGDSIVAVVNFRGEPAPMPAHGERLISTAPHAGRRLSPYEAVLLRRG